MPTTELPIRSEPLVEQDVVALFNQMLSSGLIRGIQLIASSQWKQYDGLFRVKMMPPFEDFILSDNNPLGVNEENFMDGPLESSIKVLEYKFTIDGLIEEFQAGIKSIEDVGLAVAWEMGEKYKAIFEVVSYLDRSNVHHRSIHGTTHSFTHSVSGSRAFEIIILKDLIRYLQDPDTEEQNQKDKYGMNI